ncbi:MAG: carboxymuconolactone decarboxylase family protein [Mariniphaga sp.]|jgi:AhpD family alkylhydroperoxidase|nr:carboxymuconolactone decarboxylase family protein [Mariniphaga sp.]HLV30621.1 carboxymuconolactone decarboxylase family protein [Chitinispirillaceae bacterium]
MEKVVRINFSEKGQEAVKPLYAMGKYLKNSDIEATLQELIKIRVSQINGCAFCLDMHWKDARALGETEQRLYGLSVWNESPYYSERERAGLLWAEAVTICDVPDEVYAETSKYFSEKELIDLTMAVNLINVWNRLNIPFSKDNVGTYKAGQYD